MKIEETRYRVTFAGAYRDGVGVRGRQTLICRGQVGDVSLVDNLKILIARIRKLTVAHSARSLFNQEGARVRGVLYWLNHFGAHAIVGGAIYYHEAVGKDDFAAIFMNSRQSHLQFYVYHAGRLIISGEGGV